MAELCSLCFPPQQLAFPILPSVVSLSLVPQTLGGNAQWALAIWIGRHMSRFQFYFDPLVYV